MKWILCHRYALIIIIKYIKKNKYFIKNIIPEYRVELLESIKGWHWINRTDWDWENKSKELKDYCKTNKCPNHPHPIFGQWVSDQKANYKKGKLSGEQIKSLESIDGWFWSEYHRWIDKSERLRAYYAEHNEHPSRSEKEFGNWISNNRGSYNRNSMKPEKIKILESIPGWEWVVKK